MDGQDTQTRNPNSPNTDPNKPATAERTQSFAPLADRRPAIDDAARRGFNDQNNVRLDAQGRPIPDVYDERRAAGTMATTDIPALADSEIAHVRHIMQKYFANELPPAPPVLLDKNAQPQYEPMMDGDGKQVFDAVSGHPVFRPKRVIA